MVNEAFDLSKALLNETKKGYAPMVIYDDNGQFAVTDEGCSTVRMKSHQGLNISAYAESPWFEDTPEKAWENYINRRGE